MDFVPDSPQQLQEFLRDSAALRTAKTPGYDGKRHPIPDQSGPGAEYSIQGRITGSPFDNVPAGYTLGPLNSILNVIIQNTQNDIIPWSWYPMLRDRQLRRMWKSESIFAGGVYAMAARTSALSWDVQTPQIRIQARYQSLIANADLGGGFKKLVEKTVIDLLTQDNGAFWELLGAGAPDQQLRGPVLGIAYLDSGMIWRTHDPVYPCIYINPYTGRYHALHRSRVVDMSSLTQPDELARGIGFCAVSRVQRWLSLAYAEATYKDEKISGRFKRGIIYGSGATIKQFDNAVQAIEMENDARGLTAFSGIPVLMTMAQDLKLNILDLARLPDGFDFEKEINQYVAVVALGLGTDMRELWPAASSGATKADANTQHMKSQGKGVADIIQTIEHAINWYVLPEGVVFEFDFTDEERELLNAQIKQIKAQTLNVLSLTGGLAPEEVRNQAIHEGIIDPDALTVPDQKIVASDSAPVSTNPAEAADQTESETPISIKSKAERSTTADAYDKALRKLWAQYSGGGYSIEWLKREFTRLLIEYLRKGFGAGLNGKQYSADGLDKLQTIARNSYHYFDKSFLPDIKEIERVAPKDQRSTLLDSKLAQFAMYAGAAWVAQWAGLGDALAQQETQPRVMRMLDANSKHCLTCPEKAGIYDSFAAMERQVGLPGDGNDDCLTNCRCHVLIEDENGDWVPSVGDPDEYAVPSFEVA